MGVAANVIVGVGRIYAAPLGSPLPSEQWVWPSEWEDLGWTIGGIRLELGQEAAQILMDQSNLPVAMAHLETWAIVRTKLAEATAENLLRAIPGATRMEARTDTRDDIGVGGGVVVPRMIGIEGMGPGGVARTILLHHTVPADSTGFFREKEAAGLIPFSGLAADTGDGFIDIIDDDPTRPPSATLLLVHHGWVSAGETQFDLPARKATGSDPIVHINGVTQTPSRHYSVVQYSGFTRIVFAGATPSGDLIDVWYQREA